MQEEKRKKEKGKKEKNLENIICALLAETTTLMKTKEYWQDFSFPTGGLNFGLVGIITRKKTHFQSTSF